MVYNYMEACRKKIYIKFYLFEIQNLNINSLPPPANQQCFMQYHENI